MAGLISYSIVVAGESALDMSLPPLDGERIGDGDEEPVKPVDPSMMCCFKWSGNRPMGLSPGPNFMGHKGHLTASGFGDDGRATMGLVGVTINWFEPVRDWLMGGEPVFSWDSWFCWRSGLPSAAPTSKLGSIGLWML